MNVLVVASSRAAPGIERILYASSTNQRCCTLADGCIDGAARRRVFWAATYRSETEDSPASVLMGFESSISVPKSSIVKDAGRPIRMLTARLANCEQMLGFEVT
jgi:hypothetical protein